MVRTDTGNFPAVLALHFDSHAREETDFSYPEKDRGESI